MPLIGIAKLAAQSPLIAAKQRVRVDSSVLLPDATRCLMKNVTRPEGRDGWQIEEATERGDQT